MANNIKCAKKYYDKINNFLNSAHYNDIESKISDMSLGGARAINSISSALIEN